jgi:signal transduction histidine kinase
MEHFNLKDFSMKNGALGPATVGSSVFMEGGEALAEYHDELQLMEDLEQILSTLRHELGNSINSLKITLDVLHENYDLFADRKRKDYLNRALGLVARQQRLTDAMKAYALFNVKTREQIDMAPFLRGFLNMACDKLKNTKIRLHYFLEVDPCRVMIDGTAFLKIMEAVFENAVEALEAVEKPEIEIKATALGDKVFILTKDNGSGIRKKDLPKIFIPLFTTKPRKMGMGLSIVRKLLWGMGGCIGVESIAGYGTEIKIWLDTISGQKAETEKMQLPHAE